MTDKNNSEKTVLVTGGTGSFGKTITKTLLEKGYGEIRIFSRDEWKQEDMRIRCADKRLKFYIGDVRSRESLDQAMQGVDLVFHAAALKQVPSCEFFPIEAVMTNIIGSHNVVEAAVAAGVRKVVCLGTDKAVYPVNSMGMTKALMEKVAQARARNLNDSNTVICSVRYGNVMYSRGSVIPLFINQLKEGKSLTVTDPKMTRFMLPLSQSVELVEFAFENANQGDVFIKKAASCEVGVLAQAVQDLFGKQVGLKVIGTRHGEKLHETLASVEELSRSDDLGDYFRIRMDARDLNYDKYFTEGDLGMTTLKDYDSASVELLDVEGTKEMLLELPEIQEELGGKG